MKKRIALVKYSPFPTHLKCRMITVLVLIGISASASATNFYRWVDENGVTQYTQHPPANEDTPYKEVQGVKEPTDATAAAQDRLKKNIDGLNERRDKKARTAEEAKAAEESARELEAYCQSIKDRITLFRSGKKLINYSEKEGDVPITDADRGRAVENMQAMMQEAECGG